MGILICSNKYLPFAAKSQLKRSIGKMNNSEKFCLKWNDFETNIRNSFRGLREEQDYFDVTLACDDGHLIEAHKII